MKIRTALTLKDGANNVKSKANTFTYHDSVSLSLHVGADAEGTNKISLEVASMNSDSLGIKGLKVSGKSSLQATGAINTISDAVSRVSKQRSALGAVQNRLEHTISNLDNVAENTTSAESRIRDTDMAKEMVEYSKNNILMQAGQSMLPLLCRLHRLLPTPSPFWAPPLRSTAWHWVWTISPAPWAATSPAPPIWHRWISRQT